MTCISTRRFSFLINGELVAEVRAFRGLRQGCPLSPYLFLLCAEGLSALIQRAECDGELMGFSSSRYGPKVSHLFFADDSLVFCKADVGECRKTKEISGWYEEASGQSINFQKSSITLSANVVDEERWMLQGVLGLNAAQPHDLYLGLPTLVGKYKK